MATTHGYEEIERLNIETKRRRNQCNQYQLAEMASAGVKAQCGCNKAG